MRNSVRSKIEIHAKVVVNFPSMYYQAVAIDGSKIGSKFCYLEGVDM